MKKIPTLFKIIYEDNNKKEIINELNGDFQEILLHGLATEKIDGSCCAIIDGEFYKRYDAKAGKTPPSGAIPCCEPDPVTGHHPHWVKVDFDDKASKWYVEAYKNSNKNELFDGTYEAIGPHFNGNPYHLEKDTLVRHGQTLVEIPRTFDGIKDYLSKHNIEGIVFWYNENPICKIRRKDFGFKWPN